MIRSGELADVARKVEILYLRTTSYRLRYVRTDELSTPESTDKRPVSRDDDGDKTRAWLRPAGRGGLYYSRSIQ